MLLASFGRLIQELFGFEEMSDALPRVLKFTVDAVAGCDWASVVLWQREQVVSAAVTDPIAAELDDVQFGTGLGPAPEAMRSEHPVGAADLAGSPQWPVLAAVAAQHGVGSALCHGLYVHHPARRSALGALNLYGAAPDAFSDEDHGFIAVVAAYVSVAVGLARRAADVERREAALHRAITTRDVIGQAKGILMERQRLSAGAAFDVLRHASQRMNRKLSEIAQHLAQTGELPS
jgi:GAF domain-containing protein